MVHVDSIPPGATFFVDGKRRGTTPFELALDEPRRVVLELKLDGHTSVRQELDLDRAQRLLIPIPEQAKKSSKKKPTKADPFQRFD